MLEYDTSAEVPDGAEELPTETPNIVIENPATRKLLNTILSVVLLVLGIFTLGLTFFPEFGLPGDLGQRIEGFVTAVVMLVSSWFGLGVTRRNYPSRAGSR